MSKDAYWFQHDSNARHDPRMTRLRMKHKMEGFGAYWCCIEFLRDQSGYEATREDFEALLFEMGIKESIFETILSIGLLIENDCAIYSESLKNRMFEWDERKRKLSEAGKRGGRPVKATKKGGLREVKGRPKPTESNKRTLQERTGEDRTSQKEDSLVDAKRVAEYFLDCILAHKPNLKVPNIDSWAKELERAVRIDGRTPRELCEVAAWSSRDPFWQSNILSAKKLRSQFDQLQSKMQQPGTQTMEQHGKAWLSLADDNDE